ncbi:MAG: hypothetical protein ACOX8L_04930 [Candidatus Methanomethylophilaceae archaeon]|jgi:hypothetical protein
MPDGKNLIILLFTAVCMIAAGSVFYLAAEDTGRAEYDIILPEDQCGYVITSDRTKVADGGSYNLTYRCKLGYVDEDMELTINSVPYVLDGSGRVKVYGAHGTQTVKVTGVKNHETLNVTAEENPGIELTVPEIVHK